MFGSLAAMRPLHTLRHLPALLALALLAACAAPAPPGPAARPRLVVFLAVDGLPQRQVLDYRDQLAPDGLARFLDRGAWFANANYGHAHTVTAAGHAVMLTGAYPERTGIIGNNWRDPVTLADQYCTADASATYIGNSTKPLDGTSPKNLMAETVGDVLRRGDARSKVIAISGKDRGAILPGGKTGTAYMYMDESGQFASSTYYMAQHPAWVDAFNAAKPADRYFKTAWTALLPEAAYARSLPDGQKWFARGVGKLPRMMGAEADLAPGNSYYNGLRASPFIDALSLDFARAAIRGEALGQDDAPDILAVSLSGHDYVNHAFSAESRLSHDHVLQLDRMLQAFLSDLDATVGKDNYIAVLTADHGFMPAPEYSQSLGRDAGRVNVSQLLARLNAGLEPRFGAGKWVSQYGAQNLLFDRKLAAGVDRVALAEATRQLLLAEPFVAAAYTHQEQLTNSRAGAPLFEQMRKAFHPQVSGDIAFALKPYWMFTSSSAATHGSPYPYDSQVPILLYGPQWFKPGRIDTAVEVVDIAPTLSRILGIAAPASSQGRLLPLVAP